MAFCSECGVFPAYPSKHTGYKLCGECERIEEKAPGMEGVILDQIFGSGAVAVPPALPWPPPVSADLSVATTVAIVHDEVRVSIPVMAVRAPEDPAARLEGLIRHKSKEELAGLYLNVSIMAQERTGRIKKALDRLRDWALIPMSGYNFAALNQTFTEVVETLSDDPDTVDRWRAIDKARGLDQ